MPPNGFYTLKNGQGETNTESPQKPHINSPWPSSSTFGYVLEELRRFEVVATDFPNSQTGSSTVATGVGLVSDQWPVSQQQEEGLKRVGGIGDAADTFGWGV